MLNTIPKTTLILTALLLLTGCGSIVKLVDPTDEYHAYAGTQYDWEMAQKWGLPLLDLPLSFILDTALLPYALSEE